VTRDIWILRVRDENEASYEVFNTKPEAEARCLEHINRFRTDDDDDEEPFEIDDFDEALDYIVDAGWRIDIESAVLEEPTLVVAHGSSRHFDFTCVARSRTEAHTALLAAWTIHQQQTGAVGTFDDCVSVSYLDTLLGAVYRDDSMILGKDAR
jgi:hypothetical protein